ncbi:hypothetical protein FQR65_LT07553 [Abscondita terminalis]|nr:hypothetical protein FQR65_LT07553 [Abscondita terminalis]
MIWGGRWFQYLLFCAGCFSTFQSGLQIGWPSAALPHLLSNTSTISMTNDEGSWVASIFLIGTIFGSILSALTLDVYGRKKMLLVTSLPLWATWVTIAYATTTAELCVARLVAGISDGFMYSSLPLYLAEVADPEIRGFLITGTTVTYLIGGFLPNLLGAFLSITNIALIFSALSSVAIFLYLLVPESPYFHMIHDNVTQARITMEKYTKNCDVEDKLNTIRTTLVEQKSDSGKWLELFTDASNRKSLCLVIASRFFQQVSGSTGILFYAQTLFQESKDDIDPVILVSVYYLLQITILIVNGLVVDRVGRRPLLISSMSMIAVALFIVSAYFTLQNVTDIKVTDYSWFPVLALFTYIIGYTLGLQNVLYLIVSEIFPLHVKSTAIGIFNITFGISATAVSKFFQYTKDEYGMHVPFIVFTIFSVVGIPFFALCIPETKNRTLEDIQKRVRANRTQPNVTKL